MAEKTNANVKQEVKQEVLHKWTERDYGSLAKCIEEAAKANGLDKLQESMTCGGGVFVGGIIAERYNYKSKDWEVIWAYELPMRHARINPADMFDGDAKLEWYATPTDKQLTDPAFKSANVKDSNGKIHRFKQTKDGDPVKVKVNVVNFLNNHWCDTVRDTALAKLQEIDPIQIRRIGAHVENRVRIRCKRWSSVD